MSKTPTNEIRERQHTRHATHYAAYQSDHHAELNQARRLVKHLATHADDPCALEALRALPASVLEEVPHALDLARQAAGTA